MPAPRSLLPALVLLAYLWFRLIDHLRIEWSLNEQYNYGWGVPFLCAYLLWRRWKSGAKENAETAKAETLKSDLSISTSSSVAGSTGASPVSFGVSPKAFPLSAFQCFSVSVLLLLSFLATRLVEIANPDWRFVSWALALEVILISLAFISLLTGAANGRHFAFPILFFLVAVPWPTVIEHPMVQFLTRAIVTATVEVLNIFGVLAVPHGNLIETANGFVDVDEACSGVRSLQAALMLALFFGERHRFSAKRRIVLCLAGLGLACVFNLARTVVLSLVAAKQGSAAVHQWHDPAGVAILVGCFTGVWALATWLSRKQPSPPRMGRGQGEVSKPSFAQLSTLNPRRTATGASFVLVLITVLLLGEIAVWAWYRSGAPTSIVEWNVSLPQQKPAFRITELPPNTVRMLRFTEGKSAKWENGDGTQWQFFYFRWAAGRTAVNLARNHTPEICLPAAGHKVGIIESPSRVQLDDASISFRSFVAGSVERPLFVFYTLWEDGAIKQHSEAQGLTVSSRLKAVRERRRNPGQRVIEIGISGARDLAQAETSLRTELPKFIRITP
jgi:exosortase